MTTPIFDFDSLSTKQVDALCDVAFGGSGMAMPRSTQRSLEAKGLIEPIENQSADRFGTFKWTTYEVPLHVHIAFCEWCSKQDVGA